MKITIDTTNRVTFERDGQFRTLNIQQSACFWKLMHEGGEFRRAGVLLSFWELAGQ